MAETLTTGSGELKQLTPREAAERLRISERTLWTLIKKQWIGHVRIGRRVLYAQDHVDAYIQRQTVGPIWGHSHLAGPLLD